MPNKNNRNKPMDQGDNRQQTGGEMGTTGQDMQGRTTLGGGGGVGQRNTAGTTVDGFSDQMRGNPRVGPPDPGAREGMEPMSPQEYSEAKRDTHMQDQPKGKNKKNSSDNC